MLAETFSSVLCFQVSMTKTLFALCQISWLSPWTLDTQPLGENGWKFLSEPSLNQCAILQWEVMKHINQSKSMLQHSPIGMVSVIENVMKRTFPGFSLTPEACWHTYITLRIVFKILSYWDRCVEASASHFRPFSGRFSPRSSLGQENSKFDDVFTNLFPLWNIGLIQVSFTEKPPL